ncbi:MAG TPA: hypothetical protein VMD53_08840 [Rhizomicrobium sp.]|nr:hypothetical protein [Rhizomicrobium sp.]
MRLASRAMMQVMSAAGLVCMTGSAFADEAKYPAMAPIVQYRMASAEEESALARSAAPPSISTDADILVLGAHGYETVAKGKNGFACLVLRSWTAGFDDPVFANLKIRGPACFNAAAVRSVLPHVLERTQWVLSGVSRTEMLNRTKAEIAAHSYVMPEPGAMCFMMAKGQYLSDNGSHHWHPHVMFYVGNEHNTDWGMDVTGSPVVTASMAPEPVTIFMVPVRKWSDGTPETMDMR